MNEKFTKRKDLYENKFAANKLYGDHPTPIKNRSCEVKLEYYITKLKYQLAIMS